MAGFSLLLASHMGTQVDCRSGPLAEKMGFHNATVVASIEIVQSIGALGESTKFALHFVPPFD
jgi:hypothetical protein